MHHAVELQSSSIIICYWPTFSRDKNQLYAYLEQPAVTVQCSYRVVEQAGCYSQLFIVRKNLHLNAACLLRIRRQTPKNYKCIQCLPCLYFHYSLIIFSVCADDI